jgi:hypothetical protein
MNAPWELWTYQEDLTTKHDKESVDKHTSEQTLGVNTMCGECRSLSIRRQETGSRSEAKGQSSRAYSSLARRSSLCHFILNRTHHKYLARSLFPEERVNLGPMLMNNLRTNAVRSLRSDRPNHHFGRSSRPD